MFSLLIAGVARLRVFGGPDLLHAFLDGASVGRLIVYRHVDPFSFALSSVDYYGASELVEFVTLASFISWPRHPADAVGCDGSLHFGRALILSVTTAVSVPPRPSLAR